MTIEQIRVEFNKLMKSTHGEPSNNQLFDLINELYKIKKTAENIEEFKKMDYDLYFFVE